MTDIARIWKVPCPRCGCHVDANLDEGFELFEVSDPIVWDGGEVEVVHEPIVWDGSDAMVAEVAAALPTPWGCHKAVLMPHDLRLRLVNNTAALDVWIEPGWRIQAIGDSFVILPPKDGDA